MEALKTMSPPLPVVPDTKAGSVRIVSFARQTVHSFVSCPAMKATPRLTCYSDPDDSRVQRKQWQALCPSHRPPRSRHEKRQHIMSGAGLRKGEESESAAYLPDFVITISVPKLWNRSHKSLDSRHTVGLSSIPSSSGSKLLMAPGPAADMDNE